MDNSRIEFAYAVLVLIEWAWAFSQLKDAVQASDGKWWPPTWKFTTAIRIFGKAAFFTYVGSVWWFDYFNPQQHEIAIYILVAIQVWVFVQWLRLPSPAVVERDARDRRQDAQAAVLDRTSIVLARRGEKLSDAGVILDERRLAMDVERHDLDEEREGLGLP